MRALVVSRFADPEALGLRDLPSPRPGPGEVVVAVEAMGVNFPDLMVIAGTYQNLPAPPFIPGKELAGVVAAIGPGVTEFRPGERVSAELEHGAFAEEVRVAARHCYRLPDAMSFDDAAAIGLAYQSAYFALVERGGFRAGETVLVTGATGGVGLAALHLVKALGGRALAGIGTAAKRDYALKHGADAIVDLAAPDLRNSLRDQVFELTENRGADIVIDMVGGKVFEASLRALAWCGRLVVVGFASGEIPSVRANYILVKNISVVGLQWSDYRDRDADRVAAVQKQIFGFYEAGKIPSPVTARFSLERYGAALDLVRARHVLGKVVLTRAS